MGVLIAGNIGLKGEHALLRWCRTRDLFGSQIPGTTGGFELNTNLPEYEVVI